MKIKMHDVKEVEVPTPHYRIDKHERKFVEILENSYTEVLFLGKLGSIHFFDSHILISEYFSADWKECSKEDYENAIDRACDGWLAFMATRQKFENSSVSPENNPS